jgi:hemolysin III
MPQAVSATPFSPAEERFNIISHGLGFLLSVIGSVLLLLKAIEQGQLVYILSAAAFGLTLCLLYAASTSYHSAERPKLRARLRIFDHAAIYLLIAGTYTPFTLITLEGTVGWVMFSTVWTIALAGVVLKLFFTGKYDLLSTIMYVAMGWLVIFAIRSLIANLPLGGLVWLLVGGAAYTIGAIFYSVKKIPFQHGIWHVFVLIGSICHFVAVYGYIL